MGHLVVVVVVVVDDGGGGGLLLLLLLLLLPVKYRSANPSRTTECSWVFRSSHGSYNKIQVQWCDSIVVAKLSRPNSSSSFQVGGGGGGGATTSSVVSL